MVDGRDREEQRKDRSGDEANCLKRTLALRCLEPLYERQAHALSHDQAFLSALNRPALELRSGTEFRRVVALHHAAHRSEKLIRSLLLVGRQCGIERHQRRFDCLERLDPTSHCREVHLEPLDRCHVRHGSLH